jgi:hypothetical protein
MIDSLYIVSISLLLGTEKAILCGNGLFYDALKRLIMLRRIVGTLLKDELKIVSNKF